MLPKSLLEVAGRPFIFHQLDRLAAHGFSRVTLCVGHRSPQIFWTVKNLYRGLRISYSIDDPPRGEVAAIRGALSSLGKRFLTLYGDTYLPIDFALYATSWQRTELPAMMLDYEGVDYGLGGLTAEVVAGSGKLVELYERLDAQHLLYRPSIEEPWHEIGTPESLAETDAYLRGER